jgi:hypothetical protein
VALSAAMGLDYHFRNPGVALRPLFAAASSFNLLLAGGNAFVGVGVQLGGGAAYFFSPSFSVAGKLMLAVPMQFTPAFQVAFFTVTPGVVASWYF